MKKKSKGTVHKNLNNKTKAQNLDQQLTQESITK